MNIANFLKLYILTFPVFLLLDMIWLGLIAKGFYAKHLGHLIGSQPKWIAAFIFYLLNVAGILTFVIIPSLPGDNLMNVLFMGGFFGLVTYATYDLTNLATIKNWPLAVTVIDLVWGISLSATVSVVSFLMAKAAV